MEYFGSSIWSYTVKNLGRIKTRECLSGKIALAVVLVIGISAQWSWSNPPVAFTPGQNWLEIPGTVVKAKVGDHVLPTAARWHKSVIWAGTRPLFTDKFCPVWTIGTFYPPESAVDQKRAKPFEDPSGWHSVKCPRAADSAPEVPYRDIVIPPDVYKYPGKWHYQLTTYAARMPWEYLGAAIRWFYIGPIKTDMMEFIVE